MKIIFDTDGTLTDFNKFIKDNAMDYFIEKYDMKVKYPNKLEIEDIFDMDNFFSKKYNCDILTAKKYTKEALDEYWVNFSRFIKFSLLGKFRDGVKEFIKYCQKCGYEIEIHTSRSKTTCDNIIGEICRKFTYLQYIFNGVKIPIESFYFYKNDEDKIKGILKSNPDIVFDDKIEVINKLVENKVNTICVDGNHNKSLEENEYLKKIDEYDIDKIENIFNELIGKKNYSVMKRISESDLLYKKVRILIPYILNKFNPIILNQENILNDMDSVLVAPNHRSTLDPLIITSIIDKNIHWAALKRFFDGKDSIFNNSKNPMLCKITSVGFKKMEYFPIERKRDNPNANNLSSIRDMNAFLNNKQYVGIFPEGTTNKSKEHDFGVFDPAFITLAKRSNSWVLPVTVLWIKDLNIKNKLIINFGKPFKVNNKEEAYKHYLTIQKQNLEENKKYANKLKETKKLIKKL